MNKKIPFLLACSVVIIVLSACGAGGGTSTDPETGSNSQSDGFTPDPADVIIPDTEGVSMRVLWTVSSFVLGQGSTLDAAAAQELVFKPLDITETGIIFNGQACQGVSFQEETVNAVDYLAATWHTTLQELGIQDQELRVIKTNCSLPGFQEYMRLADSRLIVTINGAFFFFEPAVDY